MHVDVPISQIPGYINNQDLNNHLTNIDPDSNIPWQCNFNYYSTEGFRSNNMISIVLLVNTFPFYIQILEVSMQILTTLCKC